VSPVRKPEPISVEIVRRDTDDPSKRRELVLLLAKLVDDRRRAVRGSKR
jgi:hypothetical protein